MLLLLCTPHCLLLPALTRDVQKDFKKKGFGFQELQSGVMVCRPCHSCIHRAVPDNKELGLHYRTLESLKQVGEGVPLVAGQDVMW